jgi:cytochrome P450
VARDRARIEAALEGLAGCVDDLLAARRAAPGDDLISALIAAEEAGDQLSDAELRVLVMALVFAGQDTTRHQLGGALTLFLEHPAQWARLAAVTADLPLRHVLDERRQCGVDTGGPVPFGARDRPAFATQGDRRLTRAGRTGPAASG